MFNRNRIISLTALLPLLFLFSCSNGEEKSLDAMERIHKVKQVRISTDPVHLPFESGMDTGVQGFDIDIGNEIAKDLGVEPRWLKMTGYNHQFEVLQNGEAEIVISAIAIDPAREDKFAFSEPYFESGDAISRRKDEPDIKDLASLSGKKVGVGEGRPGDAFMASQTEAANVTLVKYQNLDEALGDLNRGEINAIVGDEPILVYSGYISFPFVVTMPTEINKYSYAVVVRKGDAALLESINKTLDRLKTSGDLEALREKWFKDIPEKAEADRLKFERTEALKKAPKRLDVVINKKSGAFPMDRLDGYQLVLAGVNGSFKSGYITTDGNRGKCTFSQPIPPGDYRLDMSIFNLKTTVTIPDLPKDRLSMVMNVSQEKGIDISIK